MLISSLPIESIGLTGVIVFIGLMVITGRLVPKATVERERAQDAARIAFLEGINTTQGQEMLLLAGQNTELLGTAQLATRLLQAGRVGIQESETT